MLTDVQIAPKGPVSNCPFCDKDVGHQQAMMTTTLAKKKYNSVLVNTV